MPIQVIAHRGASAHAPENTLAAFRRAISDGADWIELDLQLTADDQVVVYHDGTLDRLTHASGPVTTYTLDQLVRLEVTSPLSDSEGEGEGESDAICSLDSVLRAVGDKLPLYLELKSAGKNDPSRSRLLAQVDAQLPPDSQHILASFDSGLVRDAIALGRRTALIVDDLRVVDVWSPEELSSLHALSLRADLASLAWRKKCDEARIALWVWTVDEIDDIEHCVALGVDAICTNHVARAHAFLSGHKT